MLTSQSRIEQGLSTPTITNNPYYSRGRGPLHPRSSCALSRLANLISQFLAYPVVLLFLARYCDGTGDFILNLNSVQTVKKCARYYFLYVELSDFYVNRSLAEQTISKLFYVLSANFQVKLSQNGE
jgi:hypothetical protein